MSRGKKGGWYNSEYLPQIAAYVHSIIELGFPKERVKFELPDKALKLDLTILNDSGEIVVIGEAKRRIDMLDSLLEKVCTKYSEENPGKEGRNEARQLAWRLWSNRAPYLWLIGPGDRRAYKVTYEPLAFEKIKSLPTAKDLCLDVSPIHYLEIPDYSNR